MAYTEYTVSTVHKTTLGNGVGRFNITYLDSSDNAPVSSVTKVKELLVTLNSDKGATIVTDSLQMTISGVKYIDKGGVTYSNLDNTIGEGSATGVVNTATGEATLTDWQAGANVVTINSLTTQDNPPPITQIIFRTPMSPLQTQSVQLFVTLENGAVLTLKADEQGNITGSKYAHGTIDYKNGVIVLFFYEALRVSDNPTVSTEPWYDVENVYQINNTNYINKPIYALADSIKYNAVAYRYLPLSSELIGLDTSRLPSDGRVEFVRVGDFAEISEKFSYTLTNPTPNKVYNVGMERLTTLDIADKTGKALAPNHAVIDLDTGLINLTADFAIGDYTLPLVADYRVMDSMIVTSADINGTVTGNMIISHDYSTNAVFSTALISNGNGTVQARAYNVFTQKAWTGVFSDELIGERATIQFNASAYPIVVTNHSTPTERWALIFTSDKNFRVVGETYGEIGTGNTSSDCIIINPITGQPFFILRAIAWSQGGQTNNAMRFNTESAAPAVWLGSATQPHKTNSKMVYDFAIEHHANIDRVRGE